MRCEVCGLAVELEQDGEWTRLRWENGIEERLLTFSLPPDGTTRCREHRAGSRWSRRCNHGHVHATVEGARGCTGEVEAWGLVVP